MDNAAHRSPAGAPQPLAAFDYQDVTLLPGPFQAQVEQARALYGGIPDDAILKGFREQAGLPAPGEGMAGWCKGTSAVIFGQLLSGLVRLGRATGDAGLIDKAVALFHGWHATLPADGNARMRLYDWDKLVCGLVDLMLYADVPAVLPALRATVGWASRTFDRSRHPADDHDFWGAGPGDTSEWYTLSENLYRAFLGTGEAAFADFAALWHYDTFWAPFALGQDPAAVQTVHAYSHVNSLSSAALAFAATGEERFRAICIHGHDFLHRTQTYATGGYGPDERLMRPDGSLGRSLDCCSYHAEIPCGSWAVFKLCRHLICMTGEARFGDWIEQVLLNGLAASLPPTPEGHAFYYGDYRLSGGTKQRYWQQWPCCAGTYLQAMAEYHNLIYFADADGIAVNLYVPSELRWRRDGQAITLRQETTFPQNPSASVTVTLEKPLRFAIRFRIPGWTSRAGLALNGVPLDIAAAPGSWATVDRVWSAGDRITLDLAMELHAQPVDAQHPDRCAILFGPVVLVQDEACCRRPLTLARDTALATRLVREGDRLRFRITNGVPERHTRYLQPLYELPENWPYFLYFDLHRPTLY